MGDFFHWEETMAIMAEDLAGLEFDKRITGGIIIGLYAFVYGLTILLWFFAAERRGNIARWIYAIFMGFACTFSAVDLITQTSEYTTSEIGFHSITTLITSASIICLFLPDARQWFAGKVQIDTSTFE